MDLCHRERRATCTFVPLQRDSDGEQDGASHADSMHGVEEVWEEDDVCLALHAEAAHANVRCESGGLKRIKFGTFSQLLYFLSRFTVSVFLVCEIDNLFIYNHAWLRYQFFIKDKM